MKKKIFAINGSAGSNTANSRLLQKLASMEKEEFEWKLFDGLKTLPHFDPDLSIENTPSSIVQFREEVQAADGVLICAPEYVFSIPSGLKNVLEWCVSTTVFFEKPVCLITASAHGVKAHEELQLIMKTIGASFTPDTTLLVQGVKSKFNEDGLTDEQTEQALQKLMAAFAALISDHQNKKATATEEQSVQAS